MGSGVRIQLGDGFPVDLADAVEPYFAKLLPVLGRDLDGITLHWTDMNEDAQINHKPRYRHAHIAVSAKWLNEDEETRWDIAAHELAHVLVNRLTFPVENLLTWLEETTNQDVGFVRETIEDAEEQVVTDIARLTLRLYFTGHE